MFKNSGKDQEKKPILDSVNSVKNKWKQKVQKRRFDLVQSKIRPTKKLLKTKSKSVDDEVETSSESLSTRRSSQSCNELSNLSRIEEEGESKLSAGSKVYRRKLFARSRNKQMSNSLDVPSIAPKSYTGSSFKSSETKCIIMLCSF